MTLEEAERCTILRCVVGSTAHGVNVDDGVDDSDEMGICIEGMQHMVTLGKPFEQVIYRTAAEREGRHDAPSGPGDLDLVIYSLRKYLTMAMKGNPTVLLPLFAPPKVTTFVGKELQALAPQIVSRRAGKAFLNYMHDQRERLEGKRGQKGVTRPKLIEQYGFDTKFAMHMLRLGFQGVELMKTGYLTLPMPPEERHWLVGVRVGKVSKEECVSRASELEAELESLLTTSPLPKQPDVKTVDYWMRQRYFHAWRKWVTSHLGNPNFYNDLERRHEENEHEHTNEHQDEKPEEAPKPEVGSDQDGRIQSEYQFGKL